MAARRGHGEAAIYKEGDRWRAAVQLEPGPDGTRRRKKLSGRTKMEVVAKLRALHTALQSGGPVPNERLTVQAFLDRWLERTLPAQVSASTLDNYGDTVRLHLMPTLGRKVLSRVSVADVDALWHAKRGEGYSPNSIRIMRAVLRKAFGQAEREGLLGRNVAALSSPPRVPPPEGRTFTVEQARHLLGLCVDAPYGALVVILLAFGLRRGEALGLRWSGLDWNGGTLAVTHSVKRLKDRDPASGRRTKVVVSELKNRRSRRTLYLTPELVDVLRRHRTKQTEERVALGPAWQDFDLVFPSGVGTPLDPDNFSHAFSKLCRRAGLGHWHPHELRHSGASLMLAQGTSLHVVSEVLGHASIAITKDVYGHLMEGDKRAAAVAMSAVLWGPSERKLVP